MSTVCSNCNILMSDKDYAGEGMCHECYYFHYLDKEYEEVAEDQDEELEKCVDEIINVLYDKEESNE